MTLLKVSQRIAFVVAWGSLLSGEPLLLAVEQDSAKPSARITFIVVDADGREVETIIVGERFYDPVDSDFDGLSDQYELLFFHSLSESGDLDGDGLPDKLEGNDLAASADIDQDGLPDAWERQHFGSLKYGPHDNPDNDDFTNVEELLRGPSFLPNRHTTIEYGGRQTGTIRRAADGKKYSQFRYERLYQGGVFKVPWNELKTERIRH